MRSIPYSSLTDQQRARAAYLFADEIFGTDAGGYVYEVNKSGEITGRVGSATSDKRAQMHPLMIVTVMQEVHVTEEMIRTSTMHMDALAASVAQKIYQQQFEEVHHE